MTTLIIAGLIGGAVLMVVLLALRWLVHRLATARARMEHRLRLAIHAEQEAAGAYEASQADDDDVSEEQLLAISIAGLELLMGDDASVCAWRHKGRVVVLARSDGASETLWRFADAWQSEMVKAIRRGWA